MQKKFEERMNWLLLYYNAFILLVKETTKNQIYFRKFDDSLKNIRNWKVRKRRPTNNNRKHW